MVEMLQIAVFGTDLFHFDCGKFLEDVATRDALELLTVNVTIDMSYIGWTHEMKGSDDDVDEGKQHNSADNLGLHLQTVPAEHHTQTAPLIGIRH